MQIILSLVILVFSFYCIYLVMNGYFIKSLDNISDWLKLSPSVAGATLMAFATSTPELATTIFAVFLPNTQPETGLGAIVGSAVFQTLFVIGFAVLVRPIKVSWRGLIRDTSLYGMVLIIFFLVLQDGAISFVESSTFVIAYIAYLAVVFSWSQAVNEEKDDDSLDIIDEEIIKTEILKGKNVRKLMKFITAPVRFMFDLIPSPDKYPKYTIPVFVLSLVLITFFSYILVISSESLAYSLGVSPALTALTVLAIGGSVPELVGSAVVSKNKKGNMAISNAMGSNIFDIVISFGLPLFIYTAIYGSLEGINILELNSSILTIFLSILGLIILVFLTKRKLNKAIGMFMCMLYVIYLIIIILTYSS